MQIMLLCISIVYVPIGYQNNMTRNHVRCICMLSRTVKELLQGTEVAPVPHLFLVHLFGETNRSSYTKFKGDLQTPAHKSSVRYKDPANLLSTHFYPVSSRYAGCYAPVPSLASSLEI